MDFDKYYPDLYILKVNAFLMDDEVQASEQFKAIVDKHPYFIEPYLNYWHYLKLKQK